nr:ribonuclease H-like domain-containing protein [Tanacetum cinerariifolium]
MLEQTFNRLQVIVSQLEFTDVEIKQDDLNQKLLTGLSPEWLMYMIVWRNRSDLDMMSLDDLYNHLKVYEPEELEITRLKARLMLFEDKDGGVAEQYRDDAPIKGRMLDEWEEAAKRVMVPTAVKVATTTVSIPTGSGVVSTTSPTIPTISSIFTTATDSTPYTRRNGKEKTVESDTPKKKKLQEQIEIARIHAEEELQIMIDGLDRNNETIAKYLQEYQQFAIELPIERSIELISDLVKYQDNYAKVLKYQTQQRKPLTRKQHREFYTSVLRNQAG